MMGYGTVITNVESIGGPEKVMSSVNSHTRSNQQQCNSADHIQTKEIQGTIVGPQWDA